MGGFTNPPPPTPDVPDIPVPSFVEQAKQLWAGYKSAGFVGSILAGLTTIIAPLMMNTMTNFVALQETLMAVLMQLMTKTQGVGTPEFFAFTAAMISDLLGVEIDAQAIQMSWALHGNIGGVQATGKALWDKLTEEFEVGQTLTPEGGVISAQRFLGFLMGFSVREANVATMISILPSALRMFDGLREYAVGMARNLGLGRLSRQALRPLITTLISDPMQWYLNNQYRPKLLSEGLAVKAWVRGEITETKLNQILAWTGYSDDAIEAIKADTYLQPGVSDYYVLYKHGGFSDQTMLEALAQRGTSPALASLQLAAQQYQDAEGEISSYLSLLRQQRLDGEISQAQMLDGIEGLPLSPQQREWFRHRVGQELEFPRAHVTLSEMQSAYTQGIIDLSDLQKFLTGKGYSDDDQDILVNLTLLKLEKAQYTLAKAEWTWLRAVAAAEKKGQAPPPKPPGIT